MLGRVTLRHELLNKYSTKIDGKDYIYTEIQEIPRYYLLRNTKIKTNKKYILKYLFVVPRVFLRFA